MEVVVVASLKWLAWSKRSKKKCHKVALLVQIVALVVVLQLMTMTMMMEETHLKVTVIGVFKVAASLPPLEQLVVFELSHTQPASPLFNRSTSWLAGWLAACLSVCSSNRFVR